MRKLLYSMLILLSLATHTGRAQHKKEAITSTQKKKMGISNKEKATALSKSFETGNRDALKHINPDKYIEHDLAAEDGLAGLKQLLAILPPTTKVNTVRAFQDGDYVFTHTDYDFFGPKIGFDVFRFENGKIVEHWDNLQEKPTAPNPSGHTMIDGPTQARDLSSTEGNKRLVKQFVEDILVHGKMDKLASYFDGDRYVQHNPHIGDGISGLGKALEQMKAQGIAMTYHKVHRILGEGSFVLAVSEGSFSGAHTAFYDLFRVENGKIAEHWDTVSTIPPKEEWKNSNGKF